ncbi:Sepiapterin reductase, partial [Cricetulus griseus]
GRLGLTVCVLTGPPEALATHWPCCGLQVPCCSLRACSHLALLQLKEELCTQHPGLRVGQAAADLDTKARVQQLLCTVCKLLRPKGQQSLLIINNAGETPYQSRAKASLSG